MEFDLLYELQIPKPHDARSEYRCYHEALEQNREYSRSPEGRHADVGSADASIAARVLATKLACRPRRAGGIPAFCPCVPGVRTVTGPQGGVMPRTARARLI